MAHQPLAGRIDPREMGARVQREPPKDIDKKKKKASERQEGAERPASKRKAGFGYADIIEATQDVRQLRMLKGLTYRPRTAESREVYELILSSVHQALDDQAHDIVRSAADTDLESLENERMKYFDKKKEIKEVLGSISTESFSQLVTLSKKITDYGG